MPTYGLEHIIAYFKALAENTPEFGHIDHEKIAFIASDISDLQSLENTSLISWPLLILGFNAQGYGNSRSIYTISDTKPSDREYNISLAILTEQESIHTFGDISATKIRLDQLSEIVLGKIKSDRKSAIENPGSNPQCCFFKDMNSTISLFESGPYGTRSALAISLNLTFHFKR